VTTISRGLPSLLLLLLLLPFLLFYVYLPPCVLLLLAPSLLLLLRLRLVVRLRLTVVVEEPALSRVHHLAAHGHPHQRVRHAGHFRFGESNRCGRRQGAADYANPRDFTHWRSPATTAAIQSLSRLLLSNAPRHSLPPILTTVLTTEALSRSSSSSSSSNVKTTSSSNNQPDTFTTSPTTRKQQWNS